MIKKIVTARISLGLLCALLFSSLPSISLAQNDLSIVPGGSDFEQKGWFVARPDYRRCISPLCGGFFVKQVNKKRTRCADGRWREECYVASIEWTGSVASNTQLLLRGKIVPRSFRGFGRLGVFVAREALAAATRAPATGFFAGVENNGIVCITTPCFSYDQLILNSSKIKEISDLDLSNVRATPDQLAKARAILARGGTLLAAGKNQQVKGQAGIGVSYVVSQFYLPLGDIR